MGGESQFWSSDQRSTRLFMSWEDGGQEKSFCGICKKMVRVLNYYDKHLCKYAEFFVGFYNQSPGVTITEDTWVIYVPWCPARDGEMIAGQRLRAEANERLILANQRSVQWPWTHLNITLLHRNDASLLKVEVQSHYYHVNFKKWRNSLLFPINSETTMMMWRQKVRDIHLAFSSSDRILGSGAVHWARVWSFQWKASVETWVRLRNLMLLPDKWPA